MLLALQVASLCRSLGTLLGCELTYAFHCCVLQRPTADQPYIAGLLDPACNNKLEPNIPAEMLYDKKDDGLDPANSWKGFYVLL